MNNPSIRFDNYIDIALRVNNCNINPPHKIQSVELPDNITFPFWKVTHGTVDVNQLFLNQYSNVYWYHQHDMDAQCVVYDGAQSVYVDVALRQSIENGQSVNVEYVRYGDNEGVFENLDLNWIKQYNIKQQIFEGTSVGEIEFKLAETGPDGRTTPIQYSNWYLYKCCNLGSDILEKIEIPYVYHKHAREFSIDDDGDVYAPVDPDCIALRDHISNIESTGIEPLTLQLMKLEDGTRHLRLFPGRYTNWVDLMLLKAMKVKQFSACIIIGNIQYNIMPSAENEIPLDLINSYLAPEYEFT